MHLFIHCDFARATWFTRNWGIKPDQLAFSSTTQLIEFLISTPIVEFQSQQERSSFLLYETLVLEAIWKTRNSVVFEGSEINVERVHQSLMRRYLEHLAVYGPNQIYKKPPRNAEWTRLEYRTIQLELLAPGFEPLNYPGVEMFSVITVKVPTKSKE
ncbi:hypothetical protein CMV_027747 [Castanea mollissima]|uniref:Uncharacterized protein n=1 Tax=Castanea mollissima TaxID=60419 RepID=A0A8J4VCV1_9ROSI|nr:hypothetical protein CMV_027747 [Castanea mollissima]